MKYKIRIDTAALQDIQDATDWYNLQSSGLGTRFQNEVKRHINKLLSAPFAYGIRFDNIRCMPLKKFPFLIHFTADDKAKAVDIYAVAHTSRNQEIIGKRNSR